MSQQAPQIPNLNSLRGQRGGLRGLAKRRGAPSNPDHVTEQEDPDQKRDKIIQQTDNDASQSRMSAVALDYLQDTFARSFITQQIARRYPIINRGTYVRTTGIDRLVDSFLNADPRQRKQIISLGAGSDTRFFRRARRNLVFHELDFASNTAAKIATIQQSTLLKDTITKSLDDPTSLTINAEKTALHSSTLNIHPIDLRDLALSASALSNLPHLDLDLPTLLLSECCLCYIPPETTTKIMATLTSVLHGSTSIILYEPIRPYDSFGKTMVQNLSSRGIELRTVKKYYSLGAQRLRLKQAGFDAGQGARSIEDIYYGRTVEAWLTDEERSRVERLEWLDEVEEWRLLGRHYCITWAWRDREDGDVFSRAWSNIKGDRTDAENGDEEMIS